MKFFDRSTSRGTSRGPSFKSTLISALLFGSHLTSAITLDLSSTDSIKNAAKQVASNMIGYYSGEQPGQAVGNLPDPYYWWEAGAMFMTLVDYWYFTGDDQYNKVVTNAMLAQVGPNRDYMPPNQTKTEGNDDQGFWGFAAMTAAEERFPNPPADQPQWLALAQAVFNSQAIRWDNNTCNGGLRWQIFTFNNGYNYKNTISNGCFFALGARLARYTGNTTYSDWANTMWDWVDGSGLVSKDYQFYDGTDVTINCTRQDHLQWSYNLGVFLQGAAYMYNYTNGSEVWKTRIDGMLGQGLKTFLDPANPNVMFEVACEPYGKCNVDQRSFKAYLSRWLAAVVKMAPYTAPTVMPVLQASAQGAAAGCAGGQNGQQCGLKWSGGFDGSTGVGENMAALQVIQSNLIGNVAGPVTQVDGGISTGNPAAGSGGTTSPDPTTTQPSTVGGKIGAGILTFLILVCLIGGAAWMVM